MKKICLLSFVMFLFCCGFVFSSCDVSFTPACEHVTVVDEAVAPTCSAEGKTAGAHCSVCQEILIPQIAVAKTEHTVEVDEAVAPTCSAEGKTEGAHCSVCREVLVPQTAVAKTEHTVVIDEALAPTCTHRGKTEGAHCSVCNETLVEREIISPLGHVAFIEGQCAATCTDWGSTGIEICEVCEKILEDETFLPPTRHQYEQGQCTVCAAVEKDYSDWSLYESHDGEQYFATKLRGYHMRLLYQDMKRALAKFHDSSEMNAVETEVTRRFNYSETLYAVASFDYLKYDLSYFEAVTVFQYFRNDHPAYYWLSSISLRDSANRIVLTTVKDYANGADRVKYNEMLCNGIKRYMSYVDGETDAYSIALGLHDAILSSTQYAYNKKGKPEDAQWAHSVIGAFSHSKFVCEGYAKLFQLLLNVAGVENRYILGDADGSHAWNLARMDDGNWYWFDLTWDDGGGALNYSYFCALDEDMPLHTPYASYNDGVSDRPTEPFHHDGILEIGETFTSGTCEYVRVSASAVKMSVIYQQNKKQVLYDGRLYDVVGYYVEE